MDAGSRRRRTVAVTVVGLLCLAAGLVLITRGSPANVTTDAPDDATATLPPTPMPVVPDELSCPTATVPRAALDAPPEPADSSDAAVSRMRSELDGLVGRAKYNAFNVDASHIRVLGRSEARTTLGVGDPSRAGFLHGAPTFMVVTVEERGGEWQPVEWSECALRLGQDGPARDRPVVWYLPPGAPAAERDATSISILVAESECASGQGAHGRIREPAIEYLDDAIVVAVAVEPRGGSQTCQGNPPTPYELQLREPLGDRELRDGGRYPPAPPPAPEAEADPFPIEDLDPGDLTLDPDGNVTLLIRNESPTVAEVEIHPLIDGGGVLPVAIHAGDDLGAWTEYRFNLRSGLHQISVSADPTDGSGQDSLEEFFELRDRAWLVLRFTGDGGEGSLQFSSHDEPPPKD